MKINFIDLQREYQDHKVEFDQAVIDVMTTAAFINGPAVTELEETIAKYLGVKQVIACSSGTDALLMALMALDIKPGDEIITTPFTFIATAETIALLGAVPVYVDIDPATFNIDVTKIEEKINSKTKAIIPVHLYGQMAEMTLVMQLAKKYNLKIIEDTAQAFGAEQKNIKAGTIGDLGTLSFFPSKNLGCYGDGGAVVTNDLALAEKLRMIRGHGSKIRYEHEVIGINGRLDTMQAAVLNVKMKYFAQTVEERAIKGQRYSEKLDNIEGVLPPIIAPGNKHTYGQYTLRLDPAKIDRALFCEKLKKQGVPTAIHYPKPLHLQPGFAYLGGKAGDFPIAEKAVLEVVSLPFFPKITEVEMDFIVNAVSVAVAP